MKNILKQDFRNTAQFTIDVLESIKSKGFRYVQVKGYTSDNKLDYMEPRYWILIPLMELPADQGKVEIYEPVNSKMLVDWATRYRDGMKVLVSYR